MTTDSRTLYATLLGLKAPWEIEDVAMDRELGEVRVRVALPAKTRWVCPDCLKPAPIHDHQERSCGISTPASSAPSSWRACHV